VKDARIVRNGAKIGSVRLNARLVQDVAREHGSFGKFLAGWPSSDEVGLLELLAKRGSRLGGNTGQMLLRWREPCGARGARVVAAARKQNVERLSELAIRGALNILHPYTRY
jgi:3-methyladenine DNA glycosylase Tag